MTSPHPVLALVSSGLERALGRARLAKTARFLTNQVRRDVPNVIESNGERDVQLLALTDENPVVFDCGAHFGEWSSSLLEQALGSVTVHAYEPSAATYDRAARALAGQAHVHQLGLSDSPGEAMLWIQHEGAGSNSLHGFANSTGAFAGAASETIRLSTVDHQMRDLGIERITLLKTDAEGHDLTILQGAKNALAQQRISLIQFEYNALWINARHFVREAFELLQGYGYQLGKVTPDGIEHYPVWHAELEKFVECNYLAWTPAWDSRVPQFSWWGP